MRRLQRPARTPARVCSAACEWNGPAYNAKTNLLYVPAVDWCGTFKEAENVRFVPGATYLGGSYASDATKQGG